MKLNNPESFDQNATTQTYFRPSPNNPETEKTNNFTQTEEDSVPRKERNIWLFLSLPGCNWISIFPPRDVTGFAISFYFRAITIFMTP